MARPIKRLQAKPEIVKELLRRSRARPDHSFAARWRQRWRDSSEAEDDAQARVDLGERFFCDLTEDVIRSGSFASVQELVDDISAYFVERNANPQPYKWTAKGEAILEKIHRARAAIDKAEAA